MTSAARVETPEPEALALRMAKHFGHKVAVEQDGPRTRIEIPAGTFELEVGDGRIEVHASAADEEGLARVQEIAGTHLARFAREAPIAVSWRQL